MAAGVTLKHKRKTSAFTGGELAAGEWGLNTNNGVWYYSTDGTSVVVVQDTGTTASPTFAGLEINANGTDPAVFIYRDDNVGQANLNITTYERNGGGIIHGNFARGTKDSPLAVQSGDITGGIGSRPYNGTDFVNSSPTSVHWVASEDFSATNYGSYLRILTTPKASTTRQERVIVSDSGTLWAHDTATFDPKVAAQSKPISDVVLLASGGAGTGVSVGVFSYANTTAGFRGGASGVGGTPASPAASTVDQLLAFLGGHGHDGTSWSAGTKALIGFKASEAWTPTAQGTYITIETTPTGSTTRAERVRVDPSGNTSIGTTSSSGRLTVAETKTNTSGFLAMVYNELTVNPASSSSATFISARNRAITSSGASAITGNLIGLYNEATHASSNALQTAVGLESLAVSSGSGGISSVAYGGRFQVQNTGTGTIVQLQTLRANTPTNTGGGAITNSYGVVVDNHGLTGTTGAVGVCILAQSGATNNTALLIGTSTIPTGNFGIYNTSTDASYFAGNIQMNDAANFVLGTTTGTKFGTAATQKLGFFNATPVLQPGATTDLLTVLSDLGLRASGTAAPITTTGAVATGPLTVGGGNAVSQILTGTATYDPANLTDGTGATTTITVTGAALGDHVIPSFSLDLQGITLTGYVSATNTVSVRFQNESGGTLNLASGTLAVMVIKR